jgi:release factor glutamine methyltransferase
MDGVFKKIANRTWKPVVQWYLKKPRAYARNGIRITVPVGVFHPGFFFSTQFFCDFIEGQNINNLSLCDMGCGSGMLALVAAKKGARVTAVDLLPEAIKATSDNALQNKLTIKTILSDLFQNVPPTRFDRMVVNPPYFKKYPSTPQQHAWYCGEQLEYFQHFFKQAQQYLSANGTIWMILSDECDIAGISAIAKTYQFDMKQVAQKKIRWEENYIFAIRTY